jgi:hypothetical protein
MKILCHFVLPVFIMLAVSCSVMVNSSGYEEEEEETQSEQPARISFSTGSLFPFRNNSNWWVFSEPGGNSLRIAVTDTISDDNVLYYRVSFQEHRVDTTDDWFKKSSSGILFGPSLTGEYYRFLPPRINAVHDTFTSNGSTVEYTYHESFRCDGHSWQNAVVLRYSTPIIHGFDEIILADSIGIVHLTDYDARWTVEYALDSCSIDGAIYTTNSGQE